MSVSTDPDALTMADPTNQNLKRMSTNKEIEQLENQIRQLEQITALKTAKYYLLSLLKNEDNTDPQILQPYVTRVRERIQKKENELKDILTLK